MTSYSSSWWSKVGFMKLRTQAYLVLGVLLLLVTFLGTYALNDAKWYALEADQLLTANFKASSVLRKLEIARTEELRTAAKFRVTGDPAYRFTSRRQQDKVTEAIEELQSILGENHEFTPLAKELLSLRTLEMTGRTVPSGAFILKLRDLERNLESQREERAERIRLVASDLGKIIFVSLIIAIGVTSWLAVMLYYAVLKPLDSIKRAASRIREGELSYRIADGQGFAELRALSEEFNAMAQKLEELDSMKSDFLSTVSHELRTPLTAFKEGLALLTEKQGKLPEAIVFRTLEVCNQAAKRLETMIQNLLNHAKMDSGFYSFDERPKNFVTVVEQAIAGVKTIAERRKIAINFKVNTQPFQAAFSSEGITHAVENLLLNAIKYGDNAHSIEVEINREESGDGLKAIPLIEVRVSNHGRGLLPAELTQVFGRFFRASNADGQKGVGLGLSVVKRIVEAHHGTVAADSQNSVTTFSFRIPQILPRQIANNTMISSRMVVS